MSFSEEVQKAHQEAVKVLKNSYSPYSKLQVAAALKLKGHDELVCGVNVENVSFGATICAERTALVRAHTEKGSPCELEFVVVISTIDGEPIPPCGMCLQVLSEFAGPDCAVYLGSPTAIESEHLLKDFLPAAFTKDRLLSK